ncbi:metal-dependent hydrolase [Polaribacter tangerinus]|uniref:metal-dependent hydrolase n=1 Tax=Polaribacter tangerinus TaxID=1920034 RepID=UPI000B4BC6D4|nr:metal-dependent hydrolase [Polaribacter tangerinus]
MDSLTQIVLGAACGELVLGKKIGNKALLFGAIAGTIPDLDVFIGKLFYQNEIQAMVFHRGFMHSIMFAILGAILFGWITFRLYDTQKRKHTTTLKNWISLFFWSIFTHPILDCFTPYGTQLFAPFSDYRVALNTISVVDPFYTLPFLICVIGVLFFKRTNNRRTKWLKTGIIISSIYLTFTVANKIYIDTVFKTSFDKAQIFVNRFSAQPTIFNNILWYAVGETEDAYHLAFYSLFDKKNTTDKIITIPKSGSRLDTKDVNLQKLIWFSNGYYSISKNTSSNTYKYTDLRYPMLDTENLETSVFNFTLVRKNNTWDILPFAGNPPKNEDFVKFVSRFWGI